MQFARSLRNSSLVIRTSLDEIKSAPLSSRLGLFAFGIAPYPNENQPCRTPLATPCEKVTVPNYDVNFIYYDLWIIYSAAAKYHPTGCTVD